MYSLVYITALQLNEVGDALLALRLVEGSRGLGHGGRRARDGVGEVEVRDRRRQALSSQALSVAAELRGSELGEIAGLKNVMAEQVRGNLSQSVLELDVGLVRQRHAQHVADRLQHLPVLAGTARWSNSGAGLLCATLAVDIGGTLFGVCSTRQDNVGERSTNVTVVALVDDEGVLGDLGVLVSAQEVDNLGFGGADLLGGNGEANIVETSTAGGALEHVDTLPLVSDEVGVLLGVVADLLQDIAVGLSRLGADDDERALGVGQLLAEVRAAINRLGELVEVAVLEGTVEVLANKTDLDVVVEPVHTHAGVEHSGLGTGVGANEEHGIGLLDTLETSVEEVVRTQVDTGGEGLVTVDVVVGQVLTVQTVGEVLKSNGGLDINKITGDSLELVRAELGIVNLLLN